MRLKKGIKVSNPKIPKGIKYTMEKTDNEIIIDITNPTEITKLKAQGFLEET